MSSMNFNPFQNWFEKPPNPVPSINFAESLFPKSQSPPKFASIGLPKFLKKKKAEPEEREEAGMYKKMAEQFLWECENRPDYRHAPEVDKILKEDPLFDNKENPSPQEVEAEEKWWERFRTSPVVQFMARAEEIADDMNKMELEENDTPYRREDRDLWRAVPHVPGLDGRPMPRKAIKTKEESDDKFWDFMKQFLFGLWGFRQRPYPPGRPIDVAQAIGYKRLEKRYYDFIMKTGGWWYKDRLGRSRGPCELITLKTAYGAGIIDRDTFIWGEDMDEWAPIHMVYGLEPAIATWEVRLGAAATAFLHKLQKGIPPWVPLKGREPKTYKQLQKEAIESKKRDMAVMEANDGVWPGLRTPSHALFLWASGSELTTVLESDHMPNKFIPKQLRQELAKVIPGLRPWEVISVEQAMDQISYGGEWYRKPLGTYTTGPPYIREWNRNVRRLFRIYYNLSVRVGEKLEKTLPGFNTIMEKVQKDYESRVAKRMKRREQELRERDLKNHSGHSDEEEEDEEEEEGDK
ncbi:hypothetical protein HID58_008088 [Brassica napus]|uniref:GYF domain-containing protein n=1 Tax=Brassica napus TaxID=3708 RepID=A0ABQ8DNN4_BRANA|nr:protein TIC 56, chloroplastic [Brassica napus]KAH0930971.1 hypothetical protein HID58_008088 [Brassica napus]